MAAGLSACQTAPEPVLQEAPQILRITALAGWDGRETLGGLWAAEPSVIAPNTARLRDPATGAVVDLLLMPGPKGVPPIQLSSATAEALGMTAGQKRRVEIVALRPVRIGPEPPPPDRTPPAPVAPAPPQAAPRAVIVGTFAQEANAQAAAAQFPTLATRITPVPGARPLWQLRALPATSGDEARTLANVKAAGFSDAYLSPHQGAAPGPAR